MFWGKMQWNKSKIVCIFWEVYIHNKKQGNAIRYAGIMVMRIGKIADASIKQKGRNDYEL